jgi:ATP-dependent RNA helicase RhlE
VEVSSKLIEPEKTDNLLSFDEKQKLEGDGAFQEKSKRIKKVNLGGPELLRKTHGL